MDLTNMTMKRTKSINRDAFRKAFRPYRLAPVAIAITAVFALSGCEESDETVSLYMNAQECAQANPSQAAQCEDSYRTALQEAQRTAPKYATMEDCVAEFGDAQCTQTASIDGNPVNTENANNLNPDSSQMAQANSGGSFFMPLMAGYMMGRLMGGGAPAQPLFSSRNPNSPANGKFVDATGRNYGPAVGGRQMNVPKTAMTPKPSTTSTITRGGFGNTVSRQAAAQRASATNNNRSSTGSSSYRAGG